MQTLRIDMYFLLLYLQQINFLFFKSMVENSASLTVRYFQKKKSQYFKNYRYFFFHSFYLHIY